MEIVWHPVDAVRLRRDTPQGQLPGLSIPYAGRSAGNLRTLEWDKVNGRWFWSAGDPRSEVLIVPIFQMTPQVDPRWYAIDVTCRLLMASPPDFAATKLEFLHDFTQQGVFYLGAFAERAA